MQKNVFIIHGAYGNSKENWFPWLGEELRANGFQVFIPNFPTPFGQSLENWMKIFCEYEYFLNKETVLVGHSIGAAFILNVIEGMQSPVRKCFLVSGFADFLGNDDFDSINRSFVDREFDWKKIKQNCGEFNIYHSDNDPYVPISRAEDLAEKLDTKIRMVRGAGHFNAAAGYGRFDMLLEDILSAR